MTTLSAPNCAHQSLLYCGFKKGSASGPFLPALENPHQSKANLLHPRRRLSHAVSVETSCSWLYCTSAYTHGHFPTIYLLCIRFPRTTGDFSLTNRCPKLLPSPLTSLNPTSGPLCGGAILQEAVKCGGRRHGPGNSLALKFQQLSGDSGQTQSSLMLKVENEFSLNPPCSPIRGEIGTQNCLEVYKV